MDKEIRASARSLNSGYGFEVLVSGLTVESEERLAFELRKAACERAALKRLKKAAQTIPTTFTIASTYSSGGLPVWLENAVTGQRVLIHPGETHYTSIQSIA